MLKYAGQKSGKDNKEVFTLKYGPTKKNALELIHRFINANL